MSFVARLIVLELLLIGVLTWMLQRSFVLPPPADVSAERALDRLDLASSHLRSGMLATRAGLLQNYDPLVADLDTMRAEASYLVGLPGALGARGRDVGALVDTTDGLVEQFKSDNAVLQNATATFDLLTTRIARSRVDPNLALAVGSLASTLTHLAREPSADVARQATFWVDALSKLPFPPDDVDDAKSLARHAHVLIELLPRIDDNVTKVTDLPLPSAFAAMRSELARSRAGEQRVSNRFRIALYAIAVLVSAMLIRTGFGLRSRTHALENRIKIETAVVRASGLLAECPPEKVDERIDEALALVSAAGGADRGYILIADERMPRLWCAPGVEPPADWPDSRHMFLDDLFVARPDTNYRFRLAAPALPTGLRARLRQEGMSSISCAKLVKLGDTRGLLCFERMHAFPVGLEKDCVVLDLVADVLGGVLQRRKGDERRAELERKLHRAERLEAIGIFTSGIAHNFGNVLGVIAGRAEMASDALAQGSPAMAHVEQIVDASQRGRELVDRLLDYSKSDRRLPRPIDVRALVAEVVAQVVGATGVAPRIALDATPESACVSADPGQLGQVFINVIQNAIHASGASDIIRIGVRALGSSHRRMSHGVYGGGPSVRVDVEDHGCGMDADQQARMFQPFFTTRGGGTGLGLSTAQDTVADIGGAFNVRSAPGLGTIMEIWLPACDPHRAGVSTGGTVLLLGSDRSSVERDEDLLAALGFEPVGFTTVRSALRALREDGGRFDLAIVEQSMAADAILSIRAGLWPGRPLILSRSGDDDPAVPVAAEHATYVLGRPWRPTVVATTLAHALRG